MRKIDKTVQHVDKEKVEGMYVVVKFSGAAQLIAKLRAESVNYTDTSHQLMHICYIIINSSVFNQLNCLL